MILQNTKKTMHLHNQMEVNYINKILVSGMQPYIFTLTLGHGFIAESPQKPKSHQIFIF